MNDSKRNLIDQENFYHDTYTHPIVQKECLIDRRKLMPPFRWCWSLCSAMKFCYGFLTHETYCIKQFSLKYFMSWSSFTLWELNFLIVVLNLVFILLMKIWVLYLAFNFFSEHEYACKFDAIIYKGKKILISKMRGGFEGSPNFNVN